MKQPKQTGFTLIEGLLTVLVISFGFLAVTRLQLNIWRNQIDSTQQHEAIQLGFAKLNEKRTSALMSVPAQTGGQDKVNTALTQYERSWHISPLPDSGQLNQVEIYWGSSAEKQKLSLKTVIIENNRIDDGIWVSRFD